MPPNEILLRFIEGLPSTIRSNVEAVILLYLSAPSDDPNLPPALMPDGDTSRGVVEMLRPNTDSFLTLNRVVLSAAVLDFHLSQPRNDYSKELEKRADKMGSGLLKKIALGMPLQNRHFEQASQEWFRLRESDLSLRALHEYQTKLVAELGSSL